jgi:hypothetical protein
MQAASVVYACPAAKLCDEKSDAARAGYENAIEIGKEQT